MREIYREIWKDFADKRIEERKEADIPCFTQKANKASDKRFALFTQATGALLNSGRCPALGSLSCGS